MDTNKDNLKSNILAKIEAGEVCPTSSMVFTCREGALWLAWGLSVALGSIAVAVTLYALGYQQYAVYEFTHTSRLDFVIDHLPLLWLAVFVLVVAVAVLSLKQVKHGYRYAWWLLTLAGLFFSLLVGLVLYTVGVGHLVDKQLDKMMDTYPSQARLEMKLWQQPEKGRLVGRIRALEVPTEARFEDVKGRMWVMDVTELNEEDLSLLQEGELVRVFGLLSISRIPDLFHACAALPWLLSKDYHLGELEAVQRNFRDRVSKRNKAMGKEPEGNLTPCQRAGWPVVASVGI
jgi:hypothetical protein